MRKAIVLTCALVAMAAAVAAERNTMKPNPLGDRDQILAHIHGIFAAYLRQDRDAIRRMHTADWTGFQGPSTKIERGLGDYMKNAESSLQTLRGVGYELLDTEVQVYGDVAIVYYVARYDYHDNAGRPGSIRLRSVDVYRREPTGWNQCGSHIGPIPDTPGWVQNESRP